MKKHGRVVVDHWAMMVGRWKLGLGIGVSRNGVSGRTRVRCGLGNVTGIDTMERNGLRGGGSASVAESHSQRVEGDGEMRL